MRISFRNRSEYRGRALGKRRSALVAFWAPFSIRERFIYGSLLLVALIGATTLMVRANISDAGSIVSIPAPQCSSDTGWANPELAQGQPDVPYDGAKSSITTSNSSQTTDEVGTITCLGYANTKDVRVSDAISLSLGAFTNGSQLSDSTGTYEPSFDTPSISPTKVEGRNDPIVPNAYGETSTAPLDGLLAVEVSNDNGKNWQLLHVFNDSIFNLKTPHLDILLPEEFSKNLSKLGVRLKTLRAEENNDTILVDAMTVTYKIGKKKEITLRARDEAGKPINDDLPILTPATTAQFELTAKDANDGLIQGVSSKVVQTVKKTEPALEVSAKVENEDGKIISSEPVQVEWEGSGLSNADTWNIGVEMPRSSETGKYSVMFEVTDEDGSTQSITQDFLWGVLAMNPDKSIYTVGDTGNIAITVLDELGKTVCDADVTLNIRGPISKSFTTADGSIVVGDKCTEYGDHSSPDYSVTFDFDKVGSYDLELTAATENGIYSITDQVTAESKPLFSVKRSGPTRVFPPITYSMELEITANQTFTGDITEAVPKAFTTSPTGSDSYNSITSEGDTNYLHFPVQILEGESVVLRYQFKAPDISPEFYLLGPLELFDSQLDTLVFSEQRQWQIAGDAVGRMLLFYDGATIPTGWTCISCTSGDPFYQTFIRGAATYGGTGGSATHTHTATGSVATTSASGVAWAQSGAVSANGHGHSYTPTISSESNLPTYRQLKIIRYDTTGEPTTLPTGVIGIFDNTVPSGWTRYSAQDGYYVRGEGTTSTTGGSNTHTHSISGTTSAASGDTDNIKTNGTQVGVATSTHDHTVSGTSASSSNEPPYTEVILGKLDASAAAPNDLIAMWDDESASGWNSISGTGGALNGQFIKPASSYGATGGTSAHAHSDTTIAASGVPNQTTTSRSGTSSASSTHTHEITVSNYSSENHLPPYREVVFAKRAQVTTYQQSAYRFYENNNSADVGATLAAQDTAATAPSQGTPFRLRMTMHVSVVDAPTSDTAFKLQYAQRSGSCDTAFSGETYADVTTSSGDIRFYDNSSPADGNALTTNANDPTHGSDTIRAQTYQEANNFTNAQTAVSIGEDGLWDFSLVDYSAPGSTSYCFRAVKSTGTTLNSYSAIPEITTAVPPPSMILLYDGAVIPTGWTCISCTSGDEAYQRFIRGAAAKGSGGAATHSHTATGTVGIESLDDGSNNDGAGIAESDHTHSFTPIIGAASNLPAYRQLKVIKYDSGTPGTIPAGAIALFDTTVPAGWTRYSAQDGNYVRGEGTAGTTGGSNTHTHTITGTTGASAGLEDTVNTGGNSEGVAQAGHTHDANGTSDSVNNEPPYIETILGQADSDTTIPGSMIAMWDKNPGGTWTCVSCTASDAFYQTFFKPASTYGATGGSLTHSHGTANIASGLPSQTTSTKTGSALASANHTHTVTVSNFSTDSNLPPYIEYVFAKSASTNTPPNSPTSLAQAKTDATSLSVGDWTNESTVVFSANVSDPDNPDSLALCVEVETLATTFDGVNTTCGSASSYSGTAISVNVTLSGLTDGAEYHWQARTKDGLGTYSSWVSFGGNAETARDFAVDSSGPTGTVYDGSTVGIDVDYNDGALNSLSANWTIDASVSGLVGYEYSIGTAPASTDIKAWTSTGTTTSATATGLVLYTSQPYYINVRTTDNAGSQSIISSDGQFVAPSLSFLSTPSTVQFDNLNSTNSYTSTKSTTLTTSTNAYNGYTIRAYATGLLTNANSDTIQLFDGGTYLAPDEWRSGDTGYGYTSNDSSIQGSNIFGSIPCLGGGNPPCYSPFSLTAPGDIVADHTATVSGTSVIDENFIVTHRVTTNSTQEAGDYQTTIIFTITAIY